MKQHYASLDWARGWMLVASVGVNSILFMPAWFNHAPWAGVHPVDIIFPLFVTLSGCGLAFALSRQVKFGPLVRRIVVLILAGLAYNAVMDWSLDPSTWRVTGVLQLYALLVPAISLLHLVTRSARGWAVITLLLAVGHSTLLLIYAAGCSSGVLTPECNPSGMLDPLVFGSEHIYADGARGHDPEGLVAIFGALISASAGATVGHLLRDMAARTNRDHSVLIQIRPLFVAAAYFAVFVPFFAYVFPLVFGSELPIMKRLWTAPFALSVAVLSTLLIAVGFLVVDRRILTDVGKKAALPLIALGRNSLLVYFGSHVLTRVLNQPLVGGRSVSKMFVDAIPSPFLAQSIWTLALLGFWVGLAIILHRREIYIKA